MPAAERGDQSPPYIFEDEKTTLVAFLDYLREAVAAKLSGLNEDHARKEMVPSGTSLLGLVKHLTVAELVWFVWTFGGRDVEGLSRHSQDITPEDTVDGAIDAYRSAVERSNEAIAEIEDLDQLAARMRGDREPPTLRWILVHMIEETARHAGHADILREQIDGSVGR